MNKPAAVRDAEPEATQVNISLPWRTVLGLLVALMYLLALTEPNAIRFYQIPDAWLRDDIKYLLTLVCLLCLWADVRRLQQQRMQQQQALAQQDDRIRELWHSKKQLQRKAHTYSGQADSLKRFISDKLLEYIEYDEKFLHFKSIAAEVRHNGVISFDKVQQALEQAEQQAANETDGRSYHQAQAAMRYLWDLLDLSTADNLMLHIGNHLCDCEEQYYQSLLNTDEPSSLAQQVVFSPQQAAWRALAQVHADVPEFIPGETFHFQDAQWRVVLVPTAELLGTENHLVLLLENLLKNAQFFSSRRGYKSPFSSMAFSLKEHQGQARFRLYNRGPHIDEADSDQLFKLGYSTRRVREHHGRGLGLYFVSEIVKGYEGRIEVRNLSTPEQTLHLRIELLSGRVLTETVQLINEGGQVQCLTARGETTMRANWSLDEMLSSVEVSNVDRTEPLRISDWVDRGKQLRFDPAHPEHPHWQINYQPGRHGSELFFEPLDIAGVVFDVTLPTAEHRLNHSDDDPVEAIEDTVEKFDEHFREQNPDRD